MVTPTQGAHATSTVPAFRHTPRQRLARRAAGAGIEVAAFEAPHRRNRWMWCLEDRLWMDEILGAVGPPAKSFKLLAGKKKYEGNPKG